MKSLHIFLNYAYINVFLKLKSNLATLYNVILFILLSITILFIFSILYTTIIFNIPVSTYNINYLLYNVHLDSLSLITYISFYIYKTLLFMYYVLSSFT